MTLLLLHVQYVREATLLRVHPVQNCWRLLLELNAPAASTALRLIVLWELDQLSWQVDLVDLQRDQYGLWCQTVVREGLLIILHQELSSLL